MNKTKLIILAVAAVVLIGAVAYVLRNRTQEPVPSPSVSPAQSQVFKNKYMTVNVAAGWKLTETHDDSGSVNITKGNWILYINPAAVQASAVEGGRFDEWAGGAPGVETVMGDLPKPRNGYECAKSDIEQGVTRIEQRTVVRHDFYTVTQGALTGCHLPSEAPAAWFLSVIGTHAGFNPVSSVTNKEVLPAPNGFPVRQFVITMTYKAANVDGLPRRYTKELKDALIEMDSIVGTLAFH